MSPTTTTELSSMLVERWEQVSRKFAEIAEALPAAQFESSIVPGIRTPDEVVRHVAFWNRYVAGTLRRETVNDTDNELSRAACPDRNTALQALRQSADDVVSALRGQHRTPVAEDTQLIATFIEHTSEHYGQLVVYARLIGIIPPASRT